MGQHKSKQTKNSYDVASKVTDKELKYDRPKTEVPAERKKSAISGATVSADLVVPDVTSEAVKPATDAPVSDIPEGADLKLVPAWVNEEYFIDILKENVEGFEKITKFLAFPAMAPGENYATLMLRVNIDMELKDKSEKNASFMLKVPHDSEQMRQMLEAMNFFIPENGMYADVLPELEQMYRAVGVDVCFGPKRYTFKKDPGVSHLILEDMRPHGFINTNRLEGLNMVHTKRVLRKLAQLHAASACRVATVGPFADIFMKGIFGDQAKVMMEQMIASFTTAFLNSIKNNNSSERYYDDMDKTLKSFIDDLLRISEIDENEFNVLCHGDCWSNNVLFKYDDMGTIEETYFVDFQMSKFGPPAQDLYYFILTSVNIEHKLADFDFLIRFYYDNLIENLICLKYPKKLPSLRDLHTSMFKYGAFSIMPVILTLPIVLLDPLDDKTAKDVSTFDTFMGETDAGEHFKNLLYTNKRYTACIERILPWMYNKGLLEPRDFSDEHKEDKSVQTATISAVEPVALPAENKFRGIVPDWLTQESFVDILRKNVPGFKSIKTFSVSPATAAGDNYLSVMLKVDIDIELEAGDKKFISFMMKASPKDAQARSMGDLMHTFAKETSMYNDIIPEFEKIYKNVGEHVTFAPRTFQYPNVPESDTILMENARTSGFKNADRLVGLDMDHTLSVLKKLAQFHAASAIYHETMGPYQSIFTDGVFTEENRAMMMQMGDMFFGIFLDCAKSFSGSEEYYEKIQNCREQYTDTMIFLHKINPNSFNVLNHGDVWTNNILFQYDHEGKINETQFVDFQIVKYGSPAQDLYYFLLSSPSLDIKVEQFEQCIRYYHDNLKHYLELLKYSKTIPTLKELHMELMKYGGWGYSTVCGVMSAVLLEPTNEANLDNMMSDTEGGINLKKSMFGNSRYRRHAETILIWLNRRGLLDFSLEEQPPCKPLEETISVSEQLHSNPTTSNIPAWIDEDHFLDILKESVVNFSKLLKLTAAPATKAGDNYASTILRVKADVELKDGSVEGKAFMLKIPPSNTDAAGLLTLWNFFPKETTMYLDYLVEFEQMYENAGCNMRFAPKCYKFTKDPGCDTVLMEDLGAHGFKNGNRLEGLDMEHTKSVLEKLAKLHAASVRRVELKGPYPEIFTVGIFSEKSRAIFENMSKSSNEMFLKCAREYEDNAEYIDKLPYMVETLIDKSIALGKVDPEEFNVLNHGDTWLNNIMFQYDDAGNLKETFFVDFQVSKYGSPANDLYYFLISSTQLEIKVEQFDYLIQYYHDHLVKNLTLLKCTTIPPTLKEFHCSLLKHGLLGFSTIMGVATICLIDATEHANLDNFSAETEDANKFRKQLYSNERYKAHAKTVLTWLNRRGLLDQ